MTISIFNHLLMILFLKQTKVVRNTRTARRFNGPFVNTKRSSTDVIYKVCGTGAVGAIRDKKSNGVLLTLYFMDGLRDRIDSQKQKNMRILNSHSFVFFFCFRCLFPRLSLSIILDDVVCTTICIIYWQDLENYNKPTIMNPSSCPSS